MPVFILARRFLSSSELGQLLPRKREASSHAASHSTGNHLAEIITAKVERSINVSKIGTEHDNHGNIFSGSVKFLVAYISL